MDTICVDSWDEAKSAFDDVERKRRNLTTTSSTGPSPELLFRGQGNSQWSLATTLERKVNASIPLTDYWRQMMKARPSVEAFSDKTWELMGLHEYSQWSESQTDIWGDFPGYEYMVYMRHHGFPSPLLDWSRSPYIAAFFAFREKPQSESVAIYCYLDSVGPARAWSAEDASISVRGPYVRSHRRHFLQQCTYTVCTKLTDSGLHYVPHEQAFAIAKVEQDLLWKVEIPSTRRVEVLRDLDAMNVNAFSLMGSEDSLIETLAMRHFDFEL